MAYQNALREIRRSMRKFSEILKVAEARHGRDIIQAVLKASVRVAEGGPRSLSQTPPPLEPAALAAIPDDRWLSAATKAIFCAGFNWSVVENKWSGFEEAFEGFDIGRWVLSTDDDLSALASDTRVIRNGAKLASVAHNARFFAGMAREHGGVGRFVANWPVTDQIGLMSVLDKGGARLGGNTALFFLRTMGKDCFILSGDVLAALRLDGVIDGPATSRKALAAIQAAFNNWHAQTGLTMTALSRILARSIDG
jgi:3-methyladenine DNA glycosylase Tag